MRSAVRAPRGRYVFAVDDRATLSGVGSVTTALRPKITAGVAGAMEQPWAVASASGLSTQPHFELRQLWHLSVASTTLQSLTSVVLLLWEFRRKLEPMQ